MTEEEPLRFAISARCCLRIPTCAVFLRLSHWATPPSERCDLHVDFHWVAVEFVGLEDKQKQKKSGL